MEFFDKVSETINVKGKDIAKKAKEFTEISNLNCRIKKQEKIIEQAYSDMGKLYYESHKEKPDNEYENLCQIVTNAVNEVKQLKTEVLTVKGGHPLS